MSELTLFRNSQFIFLPTRISSSSLTSRIRNPPDSSPPRLRGSLAQRREESAAASVFLFFSFFFAFLRLRFFLERFCVRDESSADLNWANPLPTQHTHKAHNFLVTLMGLFHPNMSWIEIRRPNKICAVHFISH